MPLVPSLRPRALIAKGWVWVHPGACEHPDLTARVSYDRQVVVLVDNVKLAPDGRLRVPRMVTAAILVMAAFGLGYLGWVLPSPGGSLALPTLIVFGIGFVVGIVCWIVTGSRATAVIVAAVTLAASLWTFDFSLPASVSWDPSATSQAQSALARLAASPRGQYGVPLHPCTTKLAGSVGPINAPYRECAVSTPEGQSVLFTVAGKTVRGLGYTDRAATSFPDECTRHLAGEWWMFTSTTGGCPIGYQFQGAA